MWEGLEIVMADGIILTQHGGKLIEEVADNLLSTLNLDELGDALPLKSYDFIDFFAGCGGLSYGFHRFGELTSMFRAIGAFDKDKHANNTYFQNLGLSPSDIDIADASIEDIENNLLYQQKIRNPLIVMGGPPCQGFSSHRKKDPRKDNRNSLVGLFADLAVRLDPEVIIMENVPDLLAQKHWRHFQAFKETLDKYGYKLAVDILNFAEFGVPQERFRVVAIAARDFVPTLPKPLFTRNDFRTVRDAIGALPFLKAGESHFEDPMHITSNHRQETIEVLRQIPLDGGSRPRGVGPECLDRVDGFYDVYGRLYWDRPAVTITARCRTPSCGRFVHPEQHRGLSVREAAMLQGFPINYVFEGPFDDKFKQIGNAVPPMFSLALASHVLSMLAGFNHGSTDTIQVIDQPLFRSFSGTIARYKQNQSHEY